MTKAELQRKKALLAEMMNGRRTLHLDDLLAEYRQGAGVGQEIVDCIVGELRALGVLKVNLKECPRCSWHPGATSHGASYDGLLSARIEAALAAAEARPRVLPVKVVVRPANAVDCPQAELIDGCGRHSVECVCSGTGFIVPKTVSNRLIP